MWNVKWIMEWELIGYWDLHVSLFSCEITYVYLYVFSLDYWCLNSVCRNGTMENITGKQCATTCLNEIIEVNIYEIREPPYDVLFCESDLYECCMHLMCKIRSCNVCVKSKFYVCVTWHFCLLCKMLCYR